MSLGVFGPDGRDRCAGLLGGQELLGPAGEEFQQHPVQPVDRLGPGTTELVTPVDQHPTTSSGSTSTRTGFGVRSATTATEWASTGSVLRPLPVAKIRTCADSFGGIHDGLSVMDQTVSDVLADAVATLDRPDPFGMFPAGREHLGIAGLVGAEPAHREHPGSFVDDLDGRRSLVWVHSDDHSHRCLLQC
jgi:hypothetical protein